VITIGVFGVGTQVLLDLAVRVYRRSRFDGERARFNSMPVAQAVVAAIDEHTKVPASEEGYNLIVWLACRAARRQFLSHAQIDRVCVDRDGDAVLIQVDFAPQCADCGSMNGSASYPDRTVRGTATYGPLCELCCYRLSADIIDALEAG
jgi:hypothetical protein